MAGFISVQTPILPQHAASKGFVEAAIATAIEGIGGGSSPSTTYTAGAGLVGVSVTGGTRFDIVSADPGRLVINPDTIDLALVGTAGTYGKVTVDAWGRVIAGEDQDWSSITGKPASFTPSAHTHPWSDITSRPTTLAGYGITDAQSLDQDLVAIAALSGTSGLLRKTAANTWSLDTNTYLTSYIETDPIFSASPASGITNTNITNWNSAFSWGDHSLANYQSQLISGTNIKTINGTSVLGSGDITISTGGAVEWADILNKPSTFTPSTHTHSWSEITSTPTTLVGYGITDAVPTTRTISTTSPLTGGGDLSSNRTLSISSGGISNTLFRSSVATSVVGRSTSTTGSVADIQATADNQVLRRSGGVLGFGSLDWSGVSGRPTTLSGYGITDAQSLDADLTAIAALSTTGYARRSGSNTWVLDSTIPWSSLSGVPSTFTPSAHTHSLTDLLDYGAAGGYIRSSGVAWVRVSGVAWSDLTSKPTTLSGYGITDAQPLDGDLTSVAALSTTGYARRSGTNTWVLDATIPWSSLSSVPSTFTPSAHTHALSDLLGYGAAGGYVRSSGLAWERVSGVQWSDLTSVPTTLAGYGITDGVSTSRSISTTSPLSGGGDLSANRTLSISTGGITDDLLSSIGIGFKGRSSGFGAPTTLTTAQATAMLDLFTSSLKGVVPASGGGTSTFLRADGTWSAPPAITGNLSGYVQFSSSISVALSASTYNDWAPSGLTDSTVVRITPTGRAAITGIAGGTDGRLLIIQNVAMAGNEVHIQNESTSSTLANRIRIGTPGSFQSGLVISSGGCVFLQYDIISSRWREVSSSSNNIFGEVQVGSTLVVAGALRVNANGVQVAPYYSSGRAYLGGDPSASALAYIGIGSSDAVSDTNNIVIAGHRKNIDYSTAIALSASQNNWNPTELRMYGGLTISASAVIAITGIVPPTYAKVGSETLITNGGSNTIYFPRESTSSTDVNRFNQNIVLTPGESVRLLYTAANRWQPSNRLGVLRLYETVSTSFYSTTSAENTLVSHTLPPHVLTGTTKIRIRAYGYWLNNTGATSFTLRLYLGGSVLYTHSISSSATSASRRPWYLDCTVSSNGTTNQLSGGFSTIQVGSSVSDNDVRSLSVSTSYTGTNALTVSISGQTSTSNANVQYGINSFSIEVLN